MKKALFATIGVSGVLLLSASQPVEASALLTVTVGATSVTCNNSLAITATNCGAGFVTVANSSAIQFTGSVGGYTFGGSGVTGIQVTGNQPGTPALAFVLDTKTSVTHLSGVDDAVIAFGGNNFTQPVGTGFLDASQTANWTTSGAGDSQAFIAWGRNTNDLIVPGGTATAASPNCVSPGGTSKSCSSETLNVPFNPTAPFAITGRETIQSAIGTVASYTGTATVKAVASEVPEPGSMLLLGSGLVGLAAKIRRRRRS